MKLSWTLPALRDLEAIGDYIARDSAAGANRTILRILHQAELLRAHPEMGRIGRVPQTRELVIADTSFILPYRVRGAVVEILAVFQGA